MPFGDDMLRILCDHKSKQDMDKMFAGRRWQNNDLIFPTVIGTLNSPSNILKEYKLLQSTAGLPRIRFHDLRHTAASIMLNRGVPTYVVSRILGHSKPSTTMDIYGHLIPVLHEVIGNQMDEWLTPISVDFGENTNVKQAIEQRSQCKLYHLVTGKTARSSIVSILLISLEGFL